MTNIQQQPGSSAKQVTDLSGIECRATTPADFPSKSGARRFFIDLPVGLAILTLCMLAGEQLRVYLHLIIPGNLVGLFVLLLCFRLRVIPPQLIEAAAKRLLYIMLALFVPLFVSAICLGQLWSRLGWMLLPALAWYRSRSQLR